MAGVVVVRDDGITEVLMVEEISVVCVVAVLVELFLSVVAAWGVIVVVGVVTVTVEEAPVV